MYLPEIEPRMSTRTLVTKLDKIGSVHQDKIYTKMTNKMQQCRVCSLADLHVSIDIFAHQGHLNYSQPLVLYA